MFPWVLCYVLNTWKLNILKLKHAWLRWIQIQSTTRCYWKQYFSSNKQFIIHHYLLVFRKECKLNFLYLTYTCSIGAICITFPTLALLHVLESVILGHSSTWICMAAFQLTPTPLPVHHHLQNTTLLEICIKCHSLTKSSPLLWTELHSSSFFPNIASTSNEIVSLALLNGTLNCPHQHIIVSLWQLELGSNVSSSFSIQ